MPRIPLHRDHRPQPRWRFEPRDHHRIVDRPFDGLEWGRWTFGAHDLVVVYDRGAWWFDDGRRAHRCRSLTRAVRLFWRRARAISG
jgi:hypothetical protein